ncbi:MAG: DUF3473 domain-containing protein [Gemmatimonadetes bacterium]|nr:DUF3473 domain-containing protein [Gemmatimonadota bacterium]
MSAAASRAHAVTDAVTHAFTVDVEEFFQVSAFEETVPVAQWERLPSRVEASMDTLLAIMDSHGVKGTFFTLGWVAERHPAMVRRFVELGHELASHGYWHRRVTTQQPDAFRADVRRAREVLEQVGGVAVRGYRAPTFSIIAESEWALPILVEEGYGWDSSRYPIHRRGYGSPHVARAAHVQQTAAGALLEVPMTVVEALGRALPAAGGGWFRQFPFAITDWALTARAREALPAIFYIHPWELDASQPRLPVGLLTRLRHYRGLAATATRIDRMLARHRFAPVRDVFHHLCPAAFGPAPMGGAVSCSAS